MKTYLLTLLAFSIPFGTIEALTREEKYDALHKHFSSQTVDPSILYILIALVVAVIFLSIIQRHMHMKKLKKQHDELINHQKELANHHKELLDHIRRK